LDRPGAPALIPDRGAKWISDWCIGHSRTQQAFGLRLAAGQQRAHHRGGNRMGRSSWNTPRNSAGMFSKSSRPRSIDWRQRDGNRIDGKKVLGVCDRCDGVRHVCTAATEIDVFATNGKGRSPEANASFESSPPRFTLEMFRRGLIQVRAFGD